MCCIPSWYSRTSPLLSLQFTWGKIIHRCVVLQDQVLSVCLTDTNSSEDIHINDLLVHDGYALFYPDTDESLHAAQFNLQEVSQNAIDRCFTIVVSRSAIRILYAALNKYVIRTCLFIRWEKFYYTVFCHANYTPGIYAKRYIIFVFLFIHSYVRSWNLAQSFTTNFYVKVSQVGYISPTTYQKAFIFGPQVPWRVCFHAMFWPQGLCPGGGGGVGGLEFRIWDTLKSVMLLFL